SRLELRFQESGGLHRSPVTGPRHKRADKNTVRRLGVSTELAHRILVSERYRTARNGLCRAASSGSLSGGPSPQAVAGEPASPAASAPPAASCASGRSWIRGR